MEEEQAGDEDGEHLARDHAHGEEEGAEVADGVVDDDLAARGGEGEAEGGEGEVRVAEAKVDGGGELAGADEGDEGDDAGGDVVVEHLVVGGALVVLEDLLLEGGGEAVHEEEAEEQQDAEEGVVLLAVRGGDVAAEDEQGARERDDGGDDVVAQRVAAELQEVADDQDGEHLGALAQRLRGERDVLERLVLAERGAGVGQRDAKVFVDRRGRGQRLLGPQQDRQRHQNGHEPVVQHQKGRRRKHLGLIAPRHSHDALLQNPIHQEKHNQSSSC